MRAGAGVRAGRGGGAAPGVRTAPAGVGARRGLIAALILVPAALGAVACGSAPDTISREEFVDAYLALRMAELERAGNVISEAARDSVLAASGVTEEDLDAFVEAHGTDVVLMSGIWTEVDSMMDARSGGTEPER